MNDEEHNATQREKLPSILALLLRIWIVNCAT
jgi:hypothetical protein